MSDKNVSNESGATERDGDVAGFNTIKLAAYIFREYDTGRVSDFTAQFLLQRLPQVAEAFEHTGNGRVDGEPTRATYEMACRLVLEENEMAHDYKGYGTYMTPVDQTEALRLFKSGGAVYNIYERDAEGLVDDGEDIELNKYFYGVDAEQPNVYTEKENFEAARLNKELTRRLAAIGYEFTESHGNERISRNGKAIADIEDGELVLRYGFNCKDEKADTSELWNVSKEVHEYTQAYLRALSKDDRLTQGYYRLFEHNGYVMGAAEKSAVEKAIGLGGGFKFVTWQADRDGNGYNLGHYYDDYTKAKEDFAVRAGIIRSERMLTETEVAVVRSALSDYIELDGGENVDYKRERDIKGVIEMIDSVIEPQAEEQGRDEALGQEGDGGHGEGSEQDGESERGGDGYDGDYGDGEIGEAEGAEDEF